MTPDRFDADLRAFSEKIEQLGTELLQKASVNLLADIARGTPVDTGRARANWQLSTGAPASGEVDSVDPAGSATVARAESASRSATLETPIYITNNIDYIERLEYGWSLQAPQGMARIAIARWDQIVLNALRSLG